MKFVGIVWLFALCLPAFAAEPSRDPMAWGRAYLAEGDAAAATESFLEAARRNPFDAIALNNLAISKAASGDYQAARDLLVRASQIAPQNKEIAQNYASLQAWLDAKSGPRKANNGFAKAGGMGEGYHSNLQSPSEDIPSMWQQTARIGQGTLADVVDDSKRSQRSKKSKRRYRSEERRNSTNFETLPD